MASNRDDALWVEAALLVLASTREALFCDGRMFTGKYPLAL